MKTGDRLRELRIENELTLEESAKLIGTSKQTIQRYETGEISNIPSDKIESLAKIYKTTPAYVMGWTEEKAEDKTINYLNKEYEVAINAIKELNAEQLQAVINMINVMKRS